LQYETRPYSRKRTKERKKERKKSEVVAKLLPSKSEALSTNHSTAKSKN
jgi:hypothetical protein